MDLAEPAVSLDEAKAHLNQTTLSAGDTAELQRFIRAASACAERWLHRVLAPRDVDEVHDVGRDGVVFLRRRPVLSVDTVTVDAGRPSELVVPDQHANPGTAKLRVPLARGRQMTVQFRAGMDPVPDHFKVGVLMIVAHLWRTQRPQAGRNRGYGSQLDDETQMVAGYAVPRSALEMLGPRGVT